MTCRRRTLAGAALAAAIPWAPYAGAQTTTLEDKDRIIALAPEFAGRNQSHQFWTTPNQSQWAWHAGAVAADRSAQWIQVYELQRGWHWPQQQPITEATVRSTGSFFKERKIDDLRGDLGGGGTQRDRLAQFRTGDQECFIRIVYDAAAIFSSTMSSTLPNRAAWITYCARPGAPLSEADARRKGEEWSVKGWGRASPLSAR